MPLYEKIKIKVQNKTNFELFEFTAQLDNTRFQKIEIPVLTAHSETETFNATYDTTPDPRHDHWYVYFVNGDYEYSINKKCDIYKSDKGRTVSIQITRDGNDFKVKFHMPESSDCDATMHKNKLS